MTKSGTGGMDDERRSVSNRDIGRERIFPDVCDTGRNFNCSECVASEKRFLVNARDTIWDMNCFEGSAQIKCFLANVCDSLRDHNGFRVPQILLQHAVFDDKILHIHILIIFAS